MFRADTRRSESFHIFLSMGEFTDFIGLQSEVWHAMQLIQSQWTGRRNHFNRTNIFSSGFVAIPDVACWMAEDSSRVDSHATKYGHPLPSLRTI
jgi:uncharacterized membrane protein YjdF